MKRTISPTGFIVDLIEKNPALKKECTVYSNSISMDNGTTILAISSDYKGAAGSRHSLAVFDELWGATSPNSERLYSELVPPPSEFSAWQLITSYAGFSGESNLLEGIYKRGIAGKRIDSELECYEDGDLFMFWSNTPRQPWLTGHRGRGVLRESTKDSTPESVSKASP